MPITPPMELISTIRPPPCARIAGSTCCTTRTQPQKLVSSCAYYDTPQPLRDWLVLMRLAL
jgi:hypothetical protein